MEIIWGTHGVSHDPTWSITWAPHGIKCWYCMGQQEMNNSE